jgi:outer membrane beta-barrel protein
MQPVFLPVFLVMLMTYLPMPMWAQDGDDHELDVIEAEIQRPPPVEKPAEVEVKAPEPTKVDAVTDLSKLSSFSDVAVMQRKYMPKTERFQFNTGISSTVNDPWNSSFGLNLRSAYGFNEAWGIELQGLFMTTNQSIAAQELQTQHTVVNVKSSFGSLVSYYGGHVMWTPMYGKLSLFNKRIIQFDMYFTAGGGITNMDGGPVSSAPTVSFGTGQILALTRSVAFRWDLTWNMYTTPNGTVSNLFLNFGSSFYLPEAEYR